MSNNDNKDSDTVVIKFPYQKQSKPKLVKPEKFVLSQSEEKVINHWNSKEGLTQMVKVPSKRMDSFRKDFRDLIRGTLFQHTEFNHYSRKYTTEEVILAIDRFYLAATDRKTEPFSLSFKEFLRNTWLTQFLYNPNPKLEVENRSLFLHFLNNKPKVKEITEENRWSYETEEECEARWKFIPAPCEPDDSIYSSRQTWFDDDLGWEPPYNEVEGPPQTHFIRKRDEKGHWVTLRSRTSKFVDSSEHVKL